MPDKKLLSLPPEEMRAMGYAVIDTLVDHFSSLTDQPITKQADTEALMAWFRQPFDEAGKNPSDFYDEMKEKVFPYIMRTGHRRFYAYIPTPSNFVSAMADALIAGFNVFAGVTQANVSPTLVEAETIRWLARELGLPAGAGGIVHAGGSLANLAGLAVARQVILGGPDADAVVYVGRETHSCVERGLSILGFPSSRIRLIESDGAFRLDAGALEKAIAADRAAGLRPFCIAASAGTTNVGAVDPLGHLADIAAANGMWLHVDGAYGGAAALTEEGKAKLKGIERAHSVVVDGHKWLFQPIECSLLLVREHRWLGETFRRTPAYMKDSFSDNPDLPDYRDLGMQTSRALRAFKLWLSLKIFGLGQFRAAIRQGMELARYVEQAVGERGRWRMAAPVSLGVAVFRYQRPDLNDEQNDDLNQYITLRLLHDGFAFVSSTELGGRKVIRLVPMHPETNEEDIDKTLEYLEGYAKEYRPG